jgi:hypothetical protein
MEELEGDDKMQCSRSLPAMHLGRKEELEVVWQRGATQVKFLKP